MDAQDAMLLFAIGLLGFALFWALGWTAVVGYAVGLGIALAAGLWLARSLRTGQQR